jgi:hypothetical protein
MTVQFLCWFLTLPFFQSEVPYKPKEEFSIDLNYTFKEKSSGSSLAFEYKNGMQARPKSSGELPHLGFKIKILKATAEETRYRAVTTNGRMLQSGKLKANELILLDMGFLDDIKDRVPDATYEIFFFTLSDKKKYQNLIYILVMEDGTFLVNNEKRGKF